MKSSKWCVILVPILVKDILYTFCPSSSTMLCMCIALSSEWTPWLLGDVTLLIGCLVFDVVMLGNQWLVGVVGV